MHAPGERHQILEGMHMHRRTVATLLAGASAMLFTSAAHAQEAGAGNEFGLTDIIVQAQKREETAQRVPIAITAVTGEALEARFAKTFVDISGSIPNASLELEGLSNFAASFFIRGLGVANRGPFVDPAVATVTDGVTDGRVATSITEFLDVEAVEVLRGPQGTLQGRNATGGAILLRHYKPELGKFSGNLGGLIGNYGRHQLYGMLNVPVVGDTVAFRVAAKWNESDGFYRNIYPGKEGRVGGQNHFTLLPSMRIKSGNLDMVIRGEYARFRDDSATLAPLMVCQADPRTTPSSGGLNSSYVDLVAQALGGDAAAALCASKPNKDVRTINQDRPIPEQADLDVWGVTGEVNYKIDDVGTITYIGNYKKNKEVSILDVDATPLNLRSSIETTEHWQTSHELRFASEFSDFVDFVAGGLYLKQNYHLDRDNWNTPNVYPNLTPTDQFSDQTNVQYGLFGQANWHLTPTLTAVTGLRYSYDKKDFSLCTQGAPGVTCESAVLLPGQTRVNGAKKSWNNTSPRIGLNWQAAERTMLYAYWARGFRAGGFNGEAATFTSSGPYDPERVDTYEIGFKADLADRRIRLNGALFWMEAKDLQRFKAQLNNNILEVITTNAAGARIKGFEMEATVLPVRNLVLTGSVGYLDAKYTDFCVDPNGTAANHPSLTPCGPLDNGIQPVDLTNLNLTRAPKWTIRLAGMYTQDLGDAGSAAFNLDWAYTTKENVTEGGFPVGTEIGVVQYNGYVFKPVRPSTSIVDASLTWRDVDKKYKVSFFVKNLTNETYLRKGSVVGANTNALGQVRSNLWNFGTYNDPRTYGIEASISF